MPIFKIHHVAEALKQVEPLSKEVGLKLADDLFESQPNVLASILALSRMDVPMRTIDIAFQIAFICHLAAKAAIEKAPTISEELQEECLAHLVANAKLLEGLDSQTVSIAVGAHIRDHPEPYLLAAAHGLLQHHDFKSIGDEAKKHFFLVVLTVVETFASVVQRVFSNPGMSLNYAG